MKLSLLPLALSLGALCAPAAHAQVVCGTGDVLIGNSLPTPDSITSSFPFVPEWTCGGAPLSTSNWYRFTVPLYVTEFTVDTCDEFVPAFLQVDTRLEVWRNCTDTAPIACNDDACGLRSRITVSNAEPGATYFIRVGGFNGATGAYFVKVTHDPSIQPNECSAAYTLQEGEPTLFSTTGASTSPPSWPCALGGNDIWFRYTTPSNTQGFFVSTRGSMYDTATQVFTGNCNGLTSVQCNDDYNGLLEGGVFVADASPNTTYLIRVGGYDGLTGDGTIVAREWQTIGSTYCSSTPTATGPSASLSGLGSDTVGDNMLTLVADDVPPQQFGLFVVSRDVGFVPPPLSQTNGNRCISGVLGRFLDVRQADLGGRFELKVDTRLMPQGAVFEAINAGETWYFQAWFRDPVNTGSNFSDGLEISFD